MNYTRRKRQHQCGMSLIELMIAMLVLAVGLVGILALVTSAIQTNSRNKKDSSATMVAQTVMETILSRSAAFPVSAANPAPAIVDCAGNTFLINTDAAAAPGAGAATIPNPPPAIVPASFAGNIDWSQARVALTQSTAAVPGYYMFYTACGTGGRQTMYEVRWNVTQLSNVTKYVTVSARRITLTINSPAGTNDLTGFAAPVTLRSAAGS